MFKNNGSSSKTDAVSRGANIDKRSQANIVKNRLTSNIRDTAGNDFKL